MSAVEVVDITYFSDVLCIWAYISQARVDAVTEKFGDAIRIKHHFCSVFSDTARKIPLAWSDKGSYEGFNSHLRHVAERFPSYRAPLGRLVEDPPCDVDERTPFPESRPAMGARSSSAMR